MSQTEFGAAAARASIEEVLDSMKVFVCWWRNEGVEVMACQAEKMALLERKAGDDQEVELSGENY